MLLLIPVVPSNHHLFSFRPLPFCCYSSQARSPRATSSLSLLTNSSPLRLFLSPPRLLGLLDESVDANDAVSRALSQLSVSVIPSASQPLTHLRSQSATREYPIPRRRGAGTSPPRTAVQFQFDLVLGSFRVIVIRVTRPADVKQAPTPTHLTHCPRSVFININICNPYKSINRARIVSTSLVLISCRFLSCGCGLGYLQFKNRLLPCACPCARVCVCMCTWWGWDDCCPHARTLTLCPITPPNIVPSVQYSD